MPEIRQRIRTLLLNAEMKATGHVTVLKGPGLVTLARSIFRINDEHRPFQDNVLSKSEGRILECSAAGRHVGMQL